MALIVFLRGVNVGGHKRFRPSIVARKLRAYDVVNVGAAGTFVVRKPGSQAKFRRALLRKLPFEAKVVFCDGCDLMRLEMENPFGTEPCPADIVWFVSILSKGLNLLNVSSYTQMMVIGVALIVAVAVDQAFSGKRGK